MCEVTGMESLMAEQIKKLILAGHPAPETSGTHTNNGINACCFTVQHIASAASLPKEHPVRGVLAAAAVKEYLRYDNDKFIDMAKEYSDSSVDVLAVMKATFKSFAHSKRGVTVTFGDPLSEKRIEVKFKHVPVSDFDFE
jgi:hypothetical protein